MPLRTDDPPQLRRLTRDGALTLTVGCAPCSDWCTLELTRACEDVLARFAVGRDDLSFET